MSLQKITRHEIGAEMAPCGCMIDLQKGDSAACEFGAAILAAEHQLHAAIDWTKDTPNNPLRRQLLTALDCVLNAYRRHVRESIELARQGKEM